MCYVTYHLQGQVQVTLQLSVKSVRTGVQPALQKVTLSPTIADLLALEASTLTIGLSCARVLSL